MDSKKMITLYGYKVVYYDLREKKPRQAHETIKVYDGGCLRACEVLKGGVHNYIEENFTSKGYFVKAIKKQKARRVLVDYGTLYAAAPTNYQGKKEFVDTITRAKSLCSSSYHRRAGKQ